MRTKTRLIGGVTAGLMLLGATTATAQDWPQWRGPNRDGKAPGFKAPETWPAELPAKWKVTVGFGDAAPAVVGDRIYAFTRQGDKEVALCLSSADGSEVWRDEYQAVEVTGAAGSHPGPRSSPAVADGKVVNLGVAGILSCLNAADGKLLWRKDPFPGVVPRFFTSYSPIIVDGMAIAHLGGAGNGALIAYDLATGDEKWRWGEEGPEYASPVLVTVDGVKQIATLTEKSVVGVAAADGKLLWRLPFVPERRAYNSVTPIVDGPTVIYAGAGRGAKAVKIEKTAEGFTPTEVWSNADAAPQYNTPVLMDGLLFGLSDQGKFFCIDAKTGQTVWVDETQNDRRGFGSVVGGGSVVLGLASAGELIAFKPSRDGYSEVARIKVAETATYAHPVVVGNRILVKDEQSLAMMTVQ